jgi:hypothetical protein
MTTVAHLATLVLSLLVARSPFMRSRGPLRGASGFSGPSPRPRSQHFLDAFRHGLQDLGYAEGQTITIETRWAEGGEC